MAGQGPTSEEVIRFARDNDIPITTSMRAMSHAENIYSAFCAGYKACIGDMADGDVDLVEMDHDELMDHIKDHVVEFSKEEFGGDE